jgi:hypothetical protein
MYGCLEVLCARCDALRDGCCYKCAYNEHGFAWEEGERLP